MASEIKFLETKKKEDEIPIVKEEVEANQKEDEKIAKEDEEEENDDENTKDKSGGLKKLNVSVDFNNNTKQSAKERKRSSKTQEESSSNNVDENEQGSESENDSREKDGKNTPEKSEPTTKVPIEIIVEIIKHLPIRSLIQCMLISKQINNIIKSQWFINDHSARRNQQQHILMCYERKTDIHDIPIYVSVIDTDSYPRNKLCITPRKFSFVLGYSHGLLCTYGLEDGDWKCVIWNLSIQRRIVVPILEHENTVVGFGVCPNSCDPKLVRICDSNWDVQVYSVSSGVWRTVTSDKTCIISDGLTYGLVELNGVIYFLAIKRKGNEGDRYYRIVTFDLTSEKFEEIDLPDSLAYCSGWTVNLNLYTRMESLALIKDYKEGDQRVYDVWILKHGAPNSYEKAFSYKAPMGSNDRVAGFRKNGEPILLTSSRSKGDRFEVYNPCSQHFTDLEVFERFDNMVLDSVHSCTETLLLINQPNTTILINDDNEDDDDGDGDDDDDDYDYDDDDYRDDDDDDDDDDDQPNTILINDDNKDDDDYADQPNTSYEAHSYTETLLLL